MSAGRAPGPWDHRSEQLIALVRLVLAGAGLAIVFVDPTQPSRHVPVAYAGFVGYLAYSAAVLALSHGRPRAWLPAATQLVDLVWVAPVLYFTEGANTPFFPFFVVFTLTAGIRWGMWAAWAVTAYSVVLYTALLLLATPHPIDLNNDLMQLGYFVVVGGLGGYLAEYRIRRERELGALRAVSETVATTRGAVRAMGEVIAEAHRRRLADAVLGILRDPETGEVLMVRDRGEARRLSAAEAAPFFASLAAAAGDATPRPRSVSPGAVVLAYVEAAEGLAYPIRAGGETVGGLFFFRRALHPRRAVSPPDGFLDLLLRQIIPQIETLWLLEQAGQTRVAEERRRIARDLHDSFIQVLAALGLRLKAVVGQLEGGTASARDVAKDLAELHHLVADELHRVRAYVAEMREPVGEPETLKALIEDAVRSFRTRTRIEAAVEVDAEVRTIPVTVAREVLPILREALSNVEKHAGASRVRAAVRVRDGRLDLSVSDDGVGFRSTADSPGRTQGHGLASIRERAALLRGTAALRPGRTGGSVLEVSVPLRAD